MLCDRRKITVSAVSHRIRGRCQEFNWLYFGILLAIISPQQMSRMMRRKIFQLKLLLSSSRNHKIALPLREFIVSIGTFFWEIYFIRLHNKRIIFINEAFSVFQPFDFHFKAIASVMRIWNGRWGIVEMETGTGSFINILLIFSIDFNDVIQITIKCSIRERWR